jgi:peptide/nickel transport system permease protein
MAGLPPNSMPSVLSSDKDSLGVALDPEGAAGLSLPVGGSRIWARKGASHPMLRFVLWRIAAGILTLLVVSILVFLATNVLPGNVATVVLGRNATAAHVAQLDKVLGLDHSLVARYLSWLGGALHGSFGLSSVAAAEGGRTTVASTIGDPLTNSLILAGIAALILLPLALLLGTLCGLKPGGLVDRIISIPTLVLGGLPEFVAGTLVISVFATSLQLLPAASLVTPGASPLATPDHLILPVLTLVICVISSIARQVRAGVIEVMRQDYVKVARLNGIKPRRVIARYVLRNAVAPSIQVAAHAIQYLIGGLIIVESVFTYPGIGSYLVNAVSTRDVPEVQAASMILATIYIAVNIVADLLVVLLVPRLRTGLS